MKAWEPALWPLAGIYALVMRVRNRGYDQGWLRSEWPAVPVVSVGNLTAGGTGKTPITAYLIQHFLESGKHIGIVSRGYGGTESGPIRVAIQGDAETATRFGDEPAWLASHFPKVPVFIGAHRLKAVRALAEECDVDGVIADDAFQHRRMKRAFDLVLVDATEPLSHYRSLPLGRLRESMGGLRRASAVFITKTNLCEPQQLRAVRELVKRNLDSEIPVVEWESRILHFCSLESGLKRPATDWRDQPVLLISGIGRPEAFRTLVERETKAKIVEHLIFPDHHSYTEEDRKSIERRAAELRASQILLTEKDAVKLRDWRPQIEGWVSSLEMRPSSEDKDLKGFYAAVDRIFL